MKTVEIEGRKFEVPNWANWVAQDEDGAWWVYSSKPDLQDNQFDNSGLKLIIIDSDFSWMDTLRKI